MSRGLELFIRMHIEKTPSMQRGRQVLTGDVIIGILGALQHDMPHGSDAVMWRWLHDANARNRIEQRLFDRIDAGRYKRPDLIKALGSIAIDALSGKPTEPQRRKLKTLWKRHGEQARRSERLIKRYKTERNKLIAEQEAATSGFRIARCQQHIDYFDSLIESERARLDAHAEKQAAFDDKCAKCGGTGEHQSLQCDACDGAGALRITPDNVRNHLRKMGVRVSDKLWRIELKPEFELILSELYQAHDDVVRELNKRLELERAA